MHVPSAIASTKSSFRLKLPIETNIDLLPCWCGIDKTRREEL